MNYEQLQQGIQDNLPIPDREELWKAIQKGDLEKYTPKQIEQGMLQEYRGNNLYHFAAYNGHLDQIPKELLTEENLLKPDNDRGSCLHFAAREGHLDQIPKELLTAENLLKHDRWGKTCLHYAADYGHLHQIPKELLTAENLLKTDNEGWTCLHFAARNGHLGQIPKELLTAENLLKPDNYKWQCWTCLHYAAKGGHLDKLPWLSYETLTELKTHFETKDSPCYKEKILKTLNDLLEKKLKKLEIIARSQTINHDTDIL
jgi:ankyrin repeat protein